MFKIETLRTELENKIREQKLKCGHEVEYVFLELNAFKCVCSYYTFKIITQKGTYEIITNHN